LPTANVGSGSFATKIDHSGHFRLSPKSRSTADIADGPVRAQQQTSPPQSITSSAPTRTGATNCVDDEIIEWLERRERRKGSRANPDNSQGHREADTYRTAKHHHEI